jgi:hypothetical protein
MAITSTLAGASGKQAPNMLSLVPLRVSACPANVLLPRAAAVGRIDHAEGNPENSLSPDAMLLSCTVFLF